MSPNYSWIKYYEFNKNCTFPEFHFHENLNFNFISLSLKFQIFISLSFHLTFAKFRFLSLFPNLDMGQIVGLTFAEFSSYGIIDNILTPLLKNYSNILCYFRFYIYNRNIKWIMKFEINCFVRVFHTSFRLKTKLFNKISDTMKLK